MNNIESGFKDKSFVLFIHGMGCSGKHPYEKHRSPKESIHDSGKTLV